jgi:hypothetical protein
MIEFFRALAGSLGIVQNKLNYTITSWQTFVKSIPAASIGLTSEKQPGFFNAGTRARTSSPWDHTFIYVGKTFAELVRKWYPELFRPRYYIFQGNKVDLPVTPEIAVEHEIVESGPLVEINKLEKYNKNDVALELWSRPITLWEIKKILFDLYLMVGMPYDVSEIASYVLPVVNPTTETMPVTIVTEKGIYTTSFVCCSTLATWAFHSVEILCRPKKYGDLCGNWQRTPPSEIHHYMKWSNKGWTRRLRNCK